MNFDLFLFAIFPYVAISTELVVSLFRYFTNSYKFSSLSSEFLEGNKLFWGSVSWHYGILVVLLGHLFAFLFPKITIAFSAHPTQLLSLEVFLLIFGMMSLMGLLILIKRRATVLRIAKVTTQMDMWILFLLLFQVATGVGIAIFYRWGSSWYASLLVPYLRSLFTLNPDISGISSLPILIKLHIFNAMVIVAILPFTRLLHFLIVPIPYLWRSWQVVIWNWDRKTRNQ